MFARFKKLRTTFHWSENQFTGESKALAPIVDTVSGVTVDASCNTTVTITCLKELYNAVGFNSSASNGNKIGITGYLGEFANIQDLQQFYADQRPDALNSSFQFISVNGASPPRLFGVHKSKNLLVSPFVFSCPCFRWSQ